MTSTFQFDGRPIPYRPGQTVAGALIAAGVRAWRTTRHEARPRGVFCGIGVCFDCLVVVGGHPNERACLVLVEDGLDVCSQEATGHDL